MQRQKLQKTLTQLQTNLLDSQQQFIKLKNSVQQYSNSFLTQVSQIAKLQGQTAKTKEQIYNLDAQYKSLYEQNIRYQYKLQKMTLKIQQYEKKKTIYQEIIKKNQDHNQNLKQKVKIMQEELQIHKNQNQKINQEHSENHFKNNLKFQDMLIMQSGTISNKMQRLSFQSANLQRIQDNIWKAKRKNKTLKDHIQKLQKQIDQCCNKTSRSLAQKSQNNKQNNPTLNKVENLYEKNKQLDTKIIKFVQWINQAQKNLILINQIDSQYAGKTSKQTLDLLRQVKRNKQHFQMVAKTMIKTRQK